MLYFVFFQKHFENNGWRIRSVTEPWNNKQACVWSYTAKTWHRRGAVAEGCPLLSQSTSIRKDRWHPTQPVKSIGMLMEPKVKLLMP